MAYKSKLNVNGTRMGKKSTKAFLNLEKYRAAQGSLRTINGKETN